MEKILVGGIGYEKGKGICGYLAEHLVDVPGGVRGGEVLEQVAGDPGGGNSRLWWSGI